MAPFENPVVLVTRPAESAQRFVSELRQVAGPFRPLISPAFELEPIPYSIGRFDAAIFTSMAGVKFADEGNGQMAWCVGKGTAAAAKAKGFKTKVGSGSAEELVHLILNEMPTGNLMHFRGENTRVNVKEALNDAGLMCSQAVIYRKSLRAPSDEALAMGPVLKNCIVPLFSAETVSIIADWSFNFSGSQVVAMSKDVAEVATVLKAAKISCAERPEIDEMTRATSRLIA